MGKSVVAKCKCGVEALVDIGSGMGDFMTTCLFPCLCESCHNIVNVNLLDQSTKCPECGADAPIPYDDPLLLGIPGRREVAKWNLPGKQLDRELVLTDGQYKCPKCGKFCLEFSDEFSLNWD